MFSAQWLALLTFSLFAIVATPLLRVVRACHLRKLMPPGPPGLPLLGNVFELPSKEMWKTFNEWNKRYGPIFSLNIAGQLIVVLNTFETVTDLLDRRSAIYADRPRFVMANEVLCGGINLGFMTYGNLWRKYRRALHEIFNIHAVSSFVPMQSRESMLLISTILDDPANWEHHIQRFSASAVLRATYGWSLFGSSSDRDQTLQKIISLNGTLSKAAVPSNYLVNIFPALIYVPRWFPGAEWKRKGLEAHKTFDNLFMGLVDDVCVRVQEGKAEHCLTARLIENERKHKLDRIETAWLAGTMFSAGSDTTTSTLCAMVLAMTLYPDVLRLAHDELDSVVGRDRAPTFEDKPNLPYIDAIVKEVLRWRPVIPLGIPRRCTQDDWYHGYRIPKGAIIFENIWAISHDASSFSDAEEFRPSRFLHSDGKDQCSSANDLDAEVPIDVYKPFGFGFGRRICPGQHLAYNSLFIAISTLLWALDIAQALNDDGYPVIPDRTAFIDTGITLHPSSFKCQIKQRFPGVKKLVDLAVLQ